MRWVILQVQGATFPVSPRNRPRAANDAPGGGVFLGATSGRRLGEWLENPTILDGIYNPYHPCMLYLPIVFNGKIWISCR